MSEVAQFWEMSPTATEILNEVKARKIQEINAAYTAEAQPLIKEYPLVEQQSWTAQNTEARAYLERHELLTEVLGYVG